MYNFVYPSAVDFGWKSVSLLIGGYYPAKFIDESSGANRRDALSSQSDGQLGLDVASPQHILAVDSIALSFLKHLLQPLGRDEVVLCGLVIREMHITG